MALLAAAIQTVTPDLLANGDTDTGSLCLQGRQRYSLQR